MNKQKIVTVLKYESNILMDQSDMTYWNTLRLFKKKHTVDIKWIKIW